LLDVVANVGAKPFCGQPLHQPAKKACSFLACCAQLARPGKANTIIYHGQSKRKAKQAAVLSSFFLLRGPTMDKRQATPGEGEPARAVEEATTKIVQSSVGAAENERGGGDGDKGKGGNAAAATAAPTPGVFAASSSLTSAGTSAAATTAEPTTAGAGAGSGNAHHGGGAVAVPEVAANSNNWPPNYYYTAAAAAAASTTTEAQQQQYWEATTTNRHPYYTAANNNVAAPTAVQPGDEDEEEEEEAAEEGFESLRSLRTGVSVLGLLTSKFINLIRVRTNFAISFFCMARSLLFVGPHFPLSLARSYP